LKKGHVGNSAQTEGQGIRDYWLVMRTVGKIMSTRSLFELAKSTCREKKL
jgi:hypothetical protein